MPESDLEPSLLISNKWHFFFSNDFAPKKILLVQVTERNANVREISLLFILTYPKITKEIPVVRREEIIVIMK